MKISDLKQREIVLLKLSKAAHEVKTSAIQKDKSNGKTNDYEVPSKFDHMLHDSINKLNRTK